jgi:hypothetical protein
LLAAALPLKPGGYPVHLSAMQALPLNAKQSPAMALALFAIVMASLFSAFNLFRIYRPADHKAKPRWLSALEIPAESLTGTRDLLVISVAAADDPLDLVGDHHLRVL